MSSGLPKMSVGFPDKIVSIIIAVTAASGSFILGYLVGKNTPTTPVIQSVAAKPEFPTPKQDFPNPMPATEPGLPAPAKEDKLPETITPPLTPENLKIEEPPVIKPEAAKDAVKKPVPPKTTKQALKPQTRPSAKTASKPAAAKSAGPEKSVETSLAYTVQAGAFKKQSEADYLRRILESKGYEVQVTESVSKGATVYKVLTGNFNNKKDAVILALKLKNTEGINAFVKPRG